MTFAAFNGQAIFGTGETAELAIADVAQWVNAEHFEAFKAEAKTAEMTPALAEIVSTVGGNTTFGKLPDGRLGTAGEEYDAA